MIHTSNKCIILGILVASVSQAQIAPPKIFLFVKSCSSKTLHNQCNGSQAQYWHDPLAEDEYAANSVFLADINNQGLFECWLHTILFDDQPRVCINVVIVVISFIQAYK